MEGKHPSRTLDYYFFPCHIERERSHQSGGKIRRTCQKVQFVTESAFYFLFDFYKDKRNAFKENQLAEEKTRSLWHEFVFKVF